MPRTLPLPKYHQVYLVLREQLVAGRFTAGLPGEMHLMKEFGVSRVTVRTALDHLASDGLIVRAAGRRTLALPPPAASARRSRAPAAFSGLLENIVDMGLRTQVKVIQCELLPASAQVDLGGYQGHGGWAVPQGALISWALMMQGGIQVNALGRRFHDETLGYSEASVQVLAQPGGAIAAATLQTLLANPP